MNFYLLFNKTNISESIFRFALIFFLFINLFIRLYFFDAPQVFDSGFYYGYLISNFLNDELDLSKLNIFGHTTFFPALMIYILFSIIKNLDYSIIIVNHIFLIIGLIYILKILHFFKIDKLLKKLVIVNIFLYNPMLLATFYTVLPDYWTAMMVFPLYYYLMKNDVIFTCIFISLIMYTKEIGFLFAISGSVYFFLSSKKLNVLPFIFTLSIYFFNISGLYFPLWPQQIPVVSHPIAYFFNIVSKVDQGFIFNLQWIPSLIICFSVIKRWDSFRFFSLENCFFACFLGFYFIFIMYSHPRYMAPFFSVLIIYFIVYVSEIKRLVSIFIVYFISSFSNIDPVSFFIAKIPSYQRGQVSSSYFSIYDKSGQNRFCDGSLYNLTFFYKYKSVNSFFEKSNLNFLDIKIPMVRAIGECSSSLRSPFIGTVNCSERAYPNYYVSFIRNKFRNSKFLMSDTIYVNNQNYFLEIFVNRDKVKHDTVVNENIQPVFIRSTYFP
jgi:hypothetical protein